MTATCTYHLTFLSDQAIEDQFAEWGFDPDHLPNTAPAAGWYTGTCEGPCSTSEILRESERSHWLLCDASHWGATATDAAKAILSCEGECGHFPVGICFHDPEDEATQDDLLTD